MREVIGWMLTTSFLCVAPMRFATAMQPRPIGITHVTVIDVEHGRRLRDQTVIIEGHRISTVGPSSQVRIPDGYGVVEARGKFVIPGFVDVHGHALATRGADTPGRQLARLTLSGVTTMFDARPVNPDGAASAAREVHDVGAAPIARIYSPARGDHELESMATTPESHPGVAAELSALAQGLPPERALRALTFEAARMIGRANDVGSVAVGRRADLLILDADPLDDVRNVSQINALVVNGRFIGSAERNRLLAQISPR